jgi:hypothetical protein
MELTMGIESYLKKTVDVKLLASLDDDAFERFFEKCRLELTYRYSPKQKYGIYKEDFRDLIFDVYEKIYTQKLAYDLDDTKLFCYANPFGQFRLVIANTKKEARKLADSFSMTDYDNVLGSVKSLRRVHDVCPNGVVMDNGEEREVTSAWRQTINLFDGAVVLSEGEERK